MANSLEKTSKKLIDKHFADKITHPEKSTTKSDKPKKKDNKIEKGM